jgi:hypothetical protein
VGPYYSIHQPQEVPSIRSTLPQQVLKRSWVTPALLIVRLVKDFSYEEEIHLLFAQRLDRERAEEFYPFIWTADLRQ